jgi:DNA-binding transcriptional MerR regulator
MMERMDGGAPWTLEELTSHVRQALEASGLDHQTNGQISDVPNGRTIRYYATIGLLDRPRLFGRTAMYGQRHLEQLVAIKRLQAEGLPLAEVQRRLLALDDDGLRRLAAVPALEAYGPVQSAPSRREQSFWSAPAAAADEKGGVQTPALHAPPRDVAVTTVAGITLAEGVTLTFEAADAVHDDDREALRAALQPVVEILRARGLLKGRTGGDR